MWQTFTIITTLAALYFAYRANKLSSKAIRLSVKEIGKLELNIGINNIVFDNTVLFVTYVIPALPKKAILNVPFTYEIENTGRAVIDNIELHIDYPNSIHPNASIGTRMDFSSHFVETMETKESLHKDGYKLHTIGFKIGNVAAGGSIGIKDSLLLRTITKIKTSIKTKTKDGVDVIGDIEGDFNYLIKFQAFSNKALILTREIHLDVVASDKFSEEVLFESKVSYLKENAKEYFETYGSVISGLIISSPTNKLDYVESKLCYEIKDFECKRYKTGFRNSSKQRGKGK